MLATMLVGTCFFCGGSDLAAAQLSPSPPVEQPKADLADDVLDSGLQMLGQGSKNGVFAPQAFQRVSAILAQGARGLTRTEIEKMLESFPKVTPGGNPPNASFSIHQDVWVDTNLRLIDAFSAYCHSLPTLAVVPIAFSNPDLARDTINATVAEQTHQRILELFKQGSITGQTRLILTDTVFYKASWKDKFSVQSTLPGAFHGQHATTQVPMMRKRVLATHCRDATWNAVRLPMSDGETEIVVLMPLDDHSDPMTWMLSFSALESLVHTGSTTEIDLSIPRFKVAGEIDGGALLQRCGITQVFKPGRANLTGIAEKAPDLFVSEVVQIAEMSVDEEGAEAVAATGVAVPHPTVAVIPTTFVVDRPFIALIRSKDSGIIHFCAVIRDLPADPAPAK